MNEVDILHMDWQITEKLSGKRLKLDKLREKYEYIDLIREEKNESFDNALIQSLNDTQEILRKKIESIENDEKLNMYILETHDLLIEYITLIKKSEKPNFMSKNITRVNPQITTLIETYLDISRKYIKDLEDTVKHVKQLCKNCSGSKFHTSENYSICKVCYTQVENINLSLRVDTNRLNTNSRYTYERKTHFRDCINQYQGKENTNIPLSIINSIIDQLYMYNIADRTMHGKDIFHRVTRENIYMFLKDIGETKYRENTNLIYYIITGKRYDDISHLEYILLEDFDKVSDSYNKKFGSTRRKNFINNQNLLYQLLMKHKHPCKKEDFSILKTTDRKAEHDHIMTSLCKILGWNMISTF
jgi:hypothetical protein